MRNISFPAATMLFFGSICSEYTSAQTTVCIGDSVVLVLTGYTGNIQWQQSLNSTTWSNIPSATNDSLVFTATITYYYRAEVTDNSCIPFYSDTVMVTVNFAPAAPAANAATSVTCTSFVANWTASAGASSYFLDVATDSGFTSFVAGYNNLNVGNVTSYSVTGLSGSTIYYYRVRAYNTCGTSANSNTITVTTSACPTNKKVFITSINYSPNLGGLAGADAKCQTRANAAGLTGTYMAWLSIPGSGPSTRFTTQSTDPYQLVNGTVVANNWTDLTDGTLDAPINITELGGAPSVNCSGLVAVFTYTLPNGTPGSVNGAQHCFDWTGSGGESTGRANSTNSFWTNAGACSALDCAESLKLYCFEQ